MKTVMSQKKMIMRGMAPQVWWLFKLKSAHAISLTFSLFFVIGIAFWLVYGILNGLMFVMIWNGIALLLGCGMLYAEMKWDQQELNL
jgi:MtN3 and saliva related transmembrane protein